MRVEERIINGQKVLIRFGTRQELKAWMDDQKKRIKAKRRKNKAQKRQ